MGKILVIKTEDFFCIVWALPKYIPSYVKLGTYTHNTHMSFSANKIGRIEALLFPTFFTLYIYIGVEIHELKQDLLYIQNEGNKIYYILIFMHN